MARGGWKRFALVFTCAAGAVLTLCGSGEAQSFSYAGPPVPIPDAVDPVPGAEVGAVISVAGVLLPIFKVTVSIDGTECSTDPGSTTVGLDHTFVSDLRLTLQSPSGTRVVIINNTDGSGNNFCQVVLDDTAAVSIQAVASANAPFTGTWKPATPLSAFSHENANGNWILLAQDFFGQDTGSIRAWTINITDLSAAPIPTLSEWGMILMCGLMALIGLAYIQWRGRRRV
jgi:subtilisin-like proprotein convertase family protein